MKKSLPVIALVCALIGIALYLHFSSSRNAVNSAETNFPAISNSDSTIPTAPIVALQSPIAPSAAIENSTTAPRSGSIPGATANAAPVPSVPVAPTPESASLPPATILDNMRVTIRAYGLEFGGNPVGTNPEITKALSGDNSKQINFLKADGNRVNANGELVDAWGTPYFFHQISGTEMEIHSAGPDRILWTLDDLVSK
jgi:hypothetical protein